MARPLRIEYEGAWYHVMNRGAGRRVTFPDGGAYQLFLDTLAEAVDRFRIEVHAYCLMPNHYHLLLRTPFANLSRGMRHIDGVYTQRHNRALATDGPLLRGRYKAIVVESDAYLLTVSRYIHRNPVDCMTPLAAQIEDWRWSSYPEYVGARPPAPWINRNEILGAMGTDGAARRYQRFVAMGVEQEITEFYARARRPPVLGSEQFKEHVLTLTPPASEVPRIERRSWRTIDEVLQAVADHEGTSVDELTARRGRPPGKSRLFAMWLCRQESGARLQEIGKRFGGLHYSAVAQAIRRLHDELGAEAIEQRRETVMSRFDP